MTNARPFVIYLGDLVHNFLGGGSYMFPLNIGFIAAYALQEFNERIRIELFKYPDQLLARLREAPPDLLGLSHYSWNSHLNGEVARIAKEIEPRTRVVYGGPNINQTEAGYRDFFATHPAADFHILGEGELAFVSLLRQLLQPGHDLQQQGMEPIGGVVFMSNGEPLVGPLLERIDDPATIPSPYLTGLLDQFFACELIPVVETNRGCPYTCAFCAQGLASRHKVKYFPLERVLAELDYIASRVEKTNILCFADANFGIASRDVQIASHVRQLQERHSYPRRCIINWVKTRQSIKVAELMGEASYLISSLQSMDRNALANIKRKNIDPTQFKEIVDHVNRVGGVSGTEIIVALPGETRESHLEGLRELFRWGVSYIICYNCLILGGTELALPEQRREFALRTKFRLMDSAFGDYRQGLLSFECEEGVRSTSTMSETEILFFRPVHWLIQFCWNYRCYFELLQFMKSAGVNPVDFILALLSGSDSAPAPVRKILADFDQESRDEWFDSPEALREHFGQAENFARLCRGEYGKLNGKYIWRVILECKKDFDAYLLATAERLLPADRGVLADLVDFCSARLLDFGNPAQMTEPRELAFGHDILAWRGNGYAGRPEQQQTPCRLYLEHDQQEALDLLLRQYRHPNMNVTLRKMSEHMRITDLFYQAELLNPPIQRYGNGTYPAANY